MADRKYYDTIDEDILKKHIPGIDTSKPIAIITDIPLAYIGDEDGPDGNIREVAFPGWYQVSDIGIGIRDRHDPDGFVMVRWSDILMVLQSDDIDDDDLDDDGEDWPGSEDDDDDDDISEDELFRELSGGKGSK